MRKFSKKLLNLYFKLDYLYVASYVRNINRKKEIELKRLLILSPCEYINKYNDKTIVLINTIKGSSYMLKQTKNYYYIE